MATATNAKYSDDAEKHKSPPADSTIARCEKHFAARVIVFADHSGVVGERVFRDSFAEMLRSKAERVHALAHTLATLDMSEFAGMADEIRDSYLSTLEAMAEEVVTLAKVVETDELLRGNQEVA
ncbi:hypothetical protein ACQUFY_04580 [Robbsia andropogonis]|uniref:hypothetical protein n=1 Tax=Robbsia andropogonis TaxID=28092 RepID=UPI003D1F33EF